MRKSLIITSLLLLLSLGGIYAVHAGVNANKDAVTLDEIIMYGDKSSAEGLVINVGTHCNYQLFWDTVYRVGNETQIKTDFRFSQKQEYQQHERIYNGVEFGIPDSGGLSASGGIDLEDEGHFIDSYFYSTKDLYKDVASRTEVGQTHSERLYLKDYYDFYPLAASIDFPNYHWDMRQERGTPDQSSEDDSRPLTEMIGEYFRIPILDSHRLEVSISKNDKGFITEMDISPVDGSGVNLWTTSIVTDNACYFTFNNQAQNGELLDLSLIPDGYGLYRLPLTKAEGDQNLRVSLEQLEMVYALDLQVHITELKLTEDKSRLLLMTREDGAYYLTVLDAVTAQELQKLKVIDCDEDVFLRSYYSDQFIANFISDGRLTVMEAVGDNGRYRSVFTVDTPEPGTLGTPSASYTAMDWDGKRLAVVEPQQEEDMNYSSYGKCSFNLSVYNRSGLLYTGKYDSSLDINEWSDYSYRCRPLDSNPISLHWGME